MLSTGIPFLEAEIAPLISLAFLLPFIAFIVLELVALDTPESDPGAAPSRTARGRPYRNSLDLDAQ
jgi:hypothetical protein